MVALMQRLIERGHAYADGSGSVYFDVASHPTYGSLTRQSLDDMQDAGEEMEEGKRDRRDFALWKAAKPSEPATAAWDTPFGRGRDRKSTRLNSSHVAISYAVFCLKKKKQRSATLSTVA